MLLQSRAATTAMRTCANSNCQTVFDADAPDRLYCTERCKRRAREIRKYHNGKAKRGPRVCVGCGIGFLRTGPGPYCTLECRDLHRQQRYGKDVVYFIRAESGGPIKIGTAGDVAHRLSSLQVGNPERLVVLRTLPGGPDAERAFHALFAHARLAGEWFEPIPELLALLT